MVLFKPKEKKENKEKRVEAKNIMLTYKRLPLEITKEIIRDKILEKENLEIKEWIVSLEKHEDGTPHSHVFLKLNKKARKPIIFFNIEINDTIFEPNYRNVKTKSDYKSFFSYTLKDGNFITNILNINLDERREMTPVEVLFIRSKEVGILKALIEYKDKHPNLAMKNFSSLYNNLMKMNAVEEKVRRVHTNTVKLENTGIREHPSFPLFLRHKAHLEKGEAPDLIITGPSGSGKSTLGTAILKSNFEQAYTESVDFEQLGKNALADDKGVIVHESTLHLKCPTNEEKVKFHQGTSNAGLRILYSYFTFQNGLLKIFAAKDLINHIGITPDVQVLRRILILMINPILKIDWTDPDVRQPILVPENLREEIKKVHYQSDMEILKSNCRIIKYFYPEIKLPIKELKEYGLDLDKI